MAAAFGSFMSEEDDSSNPSLPRKESTKRKSPARDKHAIRRRQNREAARRSRLKKQKRLESLEKLVARLQAENKNLQVQFDQLQEENTALRAQSQQADEHAMEVSTPRSSRCSSPLGVTLPPLAIGRGSSPSSSSPPVKLEPIPSFEPRLEATDFFLDESPKPTNHLSIESDPEFMPTREMYPTSKGFTKMNRESEAFVTPLPSEENLVPLALSNISPQQQFLALTTILNVIWSCLRQSQAAMSQALKHTPTTAIPSPTSILSDLSLQGKIQDISISGTPSFGNSPNTVMALMADHLQKNPDLLNRYFDNFVRSKQNEQSTHSLNWTPPLVC